LLLPCPFHVREDTVSLGGIAEEDLKTVVFAGVHVELAEERGSGGAGVVAVLGTDNAGFGCVSASLKIDWH
jgi:hypothetical protein